MSFLADNVNVGDRCNSYPSISNDSPRKNIKYAELQLLLEKC